jgi:hypothetical protein
LIFDYDRGKSEAVYQRRRDLIRWGNSEEKIFTECIRSLEESDAGGRSEQQQDKTSLTSWIYKQ